MDGTHVGNPKENERKCQIEGCEELSIGGRGVLCRKHRNKTYKQNYKKKKRKAAGLEDGDGSKMGNHVADERYILEQKYSNMLQQILVQKRLELLSTEPVTKLIQEHQQKVSQQKKRENQERKTRGCQASVEKESILRDQKPDIPASKGADLKTQPSIQAQTNKKLLSRNTQVCTFNTSQAQPMNQSVSVRQEQPPMQVTQVPIVKQNSVAESPRIQQPLIRITCPNLSISSSIQTVCTAPTSYPLKVQNNTSVSQFSNPQQRVILPGRPLVPLPATTQPKTSHERTLIANQSMLIPRPVFYTSLNPNSVLVGQKLTPMNTNTNLQFITSATTSPSVTSPPILHPSVVSSTLQSIALSNNALSGNLVGGSPATVINQSSATVPSASTLPHVTIYNSVTSTSHGLPNSKTAIPVSHCQTSQGQLSQGHIDQEQIIQSQPFHGVLSSPLLGMSKQQGNMLWQYPLASNVPTQEDVLLQVLQGAKGDHLVPGHAFADIDMEEMTSHCAGLINDGPWPVSVDI